MFFIHRYRLTRWALSDVNRGKNEEKISVFTFPPLLFININLTWGISVIFKIFALVFVILSFNVPYIDIEVHLLQKNVEILYYLQDM